MYVIKILQHECKKEKALHKITFHYMGSPEVPKPIQAENRKGQALTFSLHGFQQNFEKNIKSFFL